MKRIIYLGQKKIGEECFDIILRNQNDTLKICSAVSNTSTNVWWKTNTIYQKCISSKIPFIPNERRNTNQMKSLITKNKINTIISVQHPWIIPSEILSMVDYFAFNLHKAKLPDYKGYNACNHAILNDEKYYTSTIHRMSSEVDTGGIVFERKFAIAPDETAISLYEKASAVGKEIFLQMVKYLASGKKIPNRPLSGAGAFYSRKSIDNLRRIFDITNLREVDRKSRAFFFPPFEPAYYILENRKIYVLPKSAFNKNN